MIVINEKRNLLRWLLTKILYAVVFFENTLRIMRRKGFWKKTRSFTIGVNVFGFLLWENRILSCHKFLIAKLFLIISKRKFRDQ